MAVTVTATKLSSDQHVLKYRLVASGAGTGSIPNATLLADAVLGSPLYNVLAGTVADQPAARTALLYNTNMHVTLIERAVVKNMIFDANASANKIIIDLTAAAQDNAAAGGSILTIEYRHTHSR